LPAAVAFLQAAWVGAWAAVQGAFTGAWEVVGPALAAAWTWLQVSLPGAVAFWQSAWAGAWAAAQGAFTAAWGAIGPSLAAAWTWLQVTLPAAVAFLQAAWAGAWSAVQGAFTAAWGAVGPALAAVWTTVQVAVPAAVVWLQTTWAAAWAAMQDAFTTAWGAIGPALAAAWTTLQVSLPGAVSSLQAAWSAAWPAMQGAYTAVWDAIGPALAAIGPTVSGAAAEIGGALAAAQGNIDGAAQSLSSLAQGALAAAVQVGMFFLPALTRIGEALLGLPQSFAPVGEALWGLLAQLGEFWTQVQPLLTGLAMLVGGVLGVGGVVGMNAFAAAIRAAGPVVAASIREITAVIKLVGTVLGEVTTLVSAIAAGDWTTAWESIRSIGGAALQFLIDTLNNLKDVAVAVGSAIYDAVKNSLDDLNIDAGAVMNTIKGWWDSAWDTMAQAFQGVVDGINNIKSLVDGLKQSIDDFAGWVGGLKITPPWAGWSVPDLSWVPGMGGGQPANGGGAGQLGITYAQGGVYKVGESGRAELVVLPRGAQVIPHRQTEQILAGGGGGVTVIIQNANLRSEQDSWRLAYQIDELRRRRRV